jgi:Zn-finger domain-containing protein
MKNKEKIYDEQISPLLREAAELCQKNDIPFFSEAQFSKTGFCQSTNIMKKNVFKTYNAISQCKQEDTINIDKFLMWALKNFDCKQSFFLRQFCD